MRFSAAQKYGREFDTSAWRPQGMPDEVRSEAALDSFIRDPLERQEKEFQFAGDALSQAFGLKNAKANYELSMDMLDNAERAERKSSFGDIGDFAGSALGLGAMFVPGLQPFAPMIGAAASKGGRLIGQAIG